MSASLQHVLLTRYNLPLDDSGQNTDSDWLENRLVLFREFCVPSVAAQTHSDFVWAILVDARTRESDIRDIEFALPRQARLIKFDAPFDETPIQHVWTELGVSVSQPLITTRLDSDDCLAPSYVQSIRHAAAHLGTGDNRQALNFPFGLQWQDGRFYAAIDVDNPFMSLWEPGPEFVSVLAVSHRRMRDIAPVRQLLKRSQWLQVVHGSNVDNDIRGIRTPAVVAGRDFRKLLPGVPTGESWRGWVADFWRTGTRAVRAALVTRTRVGPTR